MRAHMTWLDEAEKRSFVEEALGILERVGVALKGSAALPVLADLGAAVDVATGVVRFPPDLVLRAVEACPRRVLFAGASPEHDVVLDEGEPAHFCSSGCAAFVLDHESGVRRPSTLTDLQAATILLDEVPEVDVLWTTITANDVPVEVRELVVCYVVLTEARKHVTLVDSPSQAEPLLRIMDIVSGDAEAFRARPRFSTLLTVGVAAAHRRAAPRLPRGHGRARRPRRGVHRADGRGDVAGHPGRDHRPGTRRVPRRRHRAAGAGARGPRGHGRLGGHHGHALVRGISYAAPECALMNVACVELAHHLGVPAAVPGLATDAKYAGVQAGYEKALKGLATAGVGADVLSGGVGHDRLGQHALPAADRGGRRGGRDDPPRARRRRHRARRDAARHDRARGHRRRLPQGEGDGAAAAGRGALRPRRSRRARPTTSGSPTGATRWRGPGSAWTRSSPAAPSAAGRWPTTRWRSSPRVCGVTPDMARALGH